MKKTFIIAAILILLLTAGYLYVRYSVLKTEDFEPETSEEKSILDLRPSLIAKLQQLVKDGSKGLYILNIGEIDPSIAASTLDAINITIVPDPAVLAQLDSMESAPDNTYKISMKGLHVDGIGIADLLSKKDFKLKSVTFDSPVIDVFEKKRSYNAVNKDTLTLYQKIRKGLNSLSIGEIIVKNAQITSHDEGNPGKAGAYKDISISMKDILIDSTTQYDKKRFLFAKEADLSMKKYSYRTADSLYFLNSGTINISAVSNILTANNIELIPRHSRQQFQKLHKQRKDRMEIKISKLVLSGIDWWTFANKESLIASRADVYDCVFADYIDKSMPPKSVKLANYPHQLIMKLPIRVALERVNVHNMSVAYDEYNPASSKQGTLSFSKINGSMRNMTNIKANISKNRYMIFNADALFMKSVPAKIEFKFDLAKTNTGNFEANIQAGAMSHTLLNYLSEPLAMVHLKSGNVKQVATRIKGDNRTAHADFQLLYDDLYIVPLEKDADKKSGLDKKGVTGFLANLLKIKSSNPTKGNDPRNFQYAVGRQHYPGFFTHLWKTMLYGIVKTIGAPERMAK
jgi:hypothetical protein